VPEIDAKDENATGAGWDNANLEVRVEFETAPLAKQSYLYRDAKYALWIPACAKPQA